MIECGTKEIVSVDLIRVSKGGDLGFQLHCFVEGKWVLIAEMAEEYMRQNTIEDSWDSDRASALRLACYRTEGLCVRCLEEVKAR